MKKNHIFGLAAMMIVAVTVTGVSALTTSYNVMPHHGPSDQSILIWVRTDPLVTTEPIVVYVFWDNVPVFEKIPDRAMKNGNYDHSWDISLDVPVNMASEGDHRIKIWLEEKNGHVTELNYQYTITDGLPSVKMWERFLEENPAFMESIRGPMGEQGETGPIGEEGLPGIGYEGPPGETGLQGEAGPRGPMGSQGDRGRLGFLYLLGLVCVNATIVIVVTWIMEAKRQ